MKRACILVATIGLLLTLSGAEPGDVSGGEVHVRYVSPEGSDDNAGASADAPLQSIKAAIDNLDAILSQSASDRGVVYIAPGTYGLKRNTALTGNAVGFCLAITNAIRLVGTGATPDEIVLQATPLYTPGNDDRACYLNHSQAELVNLSVANGEARQAKGGNVYIDADGGTVSNCVLRSGKVSNYHGSGGNLYMRGGLVTHSVISNATVSSTGDWKSGNATIDGGRMENCLITGAKDSSTGSKVVAGVYMTKGALVNCTIAGNSGASYGGLYVASSSVGITNCVIAANTVTLDGGGPTYGLANNVSGDVFVNCVLDSAETPNETCTVASAGEILKDAANGDYTLAAGSPAFDFGLGESTASTFDLVGNPRVSGGSIDAGCYEFDANALAIGFSVDVNEAILPVTATFTARISGAAEGETITYAWDFDGDGTYDETTTNASITREFNQGGYYTVSLKVTVGDREVVETKENLLHYVPSVLYVDAESAAPALPYDMWEAAAANLPEAVDFALAGCEIVVRKGTYELGRAGIELTKGVSIYGETGDPSDVIFQGKIVRSTDYKGFRINSANARIASLTISGVGRYSQSGGGIVCGGMGGVVSNCIISACSATGHNGNGGAAYLNGPITMTHCIITNCTTESQSGSTKFLINVGGGACFENNLIVGNYSSGSGTANCAALLAVGATSTARNNTFVRNTINNRGLIKVDKGAVFQNNVFAGNSYLAADAEDNPVKVTDKGFNFSTATPADVYVNCAFDETCGFETAPVEGCIVGTATEFFAKWDLNDYTLRANSPLCNRGAAYEGCSPLDLAGKPRLFGSKIDIGCYECQNGTGFHITIR